MTLIATYETDQYVTAMEFRKTKDGLSRDYMVSFPGQPYTWPVDPADKEWFETYPGVTVEEVPDEGEPATAEPVATETQATARRREG